jgi:hypothetical protein
LRHRKLRPCWRSGFALRAIIAVLLVIGRLLPLLLPAVQPPREAARRLPCQSYLRQRGQGVPNDASSAGFVRRGATMGNRWRVIILPCIDRKDVYERMDFSVIGPRPNESSARREVLEMVIPRSLRPSAPTPSVKVNGGAFREFVTAFAGMAMA